MPASPAERDGRHRLHTLDRLSARERYHLLTSLVVPRPIGWVSTVGTDGVPNLAPFSYFAALSSSPMLVGISIGRRSSGAPKDSLVNVRSARAFCVNVVTVEQLDRMNATSEALPPGRSEFEQCDVPIAWTESRAAPFVADARAVLECTLFKEVDLGEAPNTLVIGEVRTVRLTPGTTLESGSLRVDPRALEPVGRLGGGAYAMPGQIRVLDRP